MKPTNELLLSNARIVLADKVILGTVRAVDGVIVSLEEGKATKGVNFDGDYLIPGLVELHTDHLESHYSPRPGVKWNPLAAIQAHDAQIASAGITTVLDCLRLGSDESGAFDSGEMLALAGFLQQAARQGRLRSDHRLHLRCEVSSPSVLDDFLQFDEHENIMLTSLMDHAPGQRQFTNMAVFEHYHRKKEDMDEETFKAFASKRLENSERFADQHRQTIAGMCNSRGIALASHDDATLSHIDAAIDLGINIAEFPTSLDAAAAAHAKGMQVLMGAPNVVRGQSHSGNVSARDLAVSGTLDMLSSDYVPCSLLHAGFVLSLQEKLMTLEEAIALITVNPAQAIGFNDRGLIAEGYRADLIRVSCPDDVPNVKCVWREGIRVV